MNPVNLNTFSKDRVLRDIRGAPLGRIVLFDDSEYSHGLDSLKVVLLKIPLSVCASVLGLEGYIDGIKYKIPTDLHDIKVSKRERDWVLSNFLLRRSD